MSLIRKASVFAAVLLGFGVSTAHAQGMMKVNVPFAFVVGQNQFAAGQYEIREVDGASNVIAIEGAPPFMLLGPARETEMVDGWKRKYDTDMFTSSQNQVNAFKALKAKRILGITSGSGGPDLNKVYAKYFEDNGIGVVAMEGMGVEFKSIPDVPPATIASFIKKAFAEHGGADAVYILGSSLEALPLIAPLERELGVPVVQAIAARIWEIQKRLHVHEPIKGYGRLLETLPA